MSSTIAVLGAFDTKGTEYAWLCDQLARLGSHLLTINVGVLGSTDLFPVDIESAAVARAGGVELSTLQKGMDRGAAMKVMAAGAAIVVRQLFDEGRLDGIIGMGGSGGTSLITAAMRGLPIGLPKVCVSTVAGSDTGPYVGTSDITLVPSVTDVAGVNRISRMIIARAAGAIVGMVGVDLSQDVTDRPIIAASMFGNTTACVDACREQLTAAGYEVLVFHATGTGGRTMEALIDEGLVDACLDVTTTEWADTICGGIFAAGEDRLSAAGRKGIPHLIAPGCIDMVNFGPPESVPQHYRDAGRLFYEWNPSVTLMRTNEEENRRLGEVFAARANQARGPVAFLIPLRGVSILGGDGESFCDRRADRAMFDALKRQVRADIPVYEIEANINDAEFSHKAVELMLELVREKGQGGP